MADGSVLVRAADRRGGHAPRPPVPAGPSPVPAVDRSSSVVAGCVTHESGDRGVTTTCDIGQEALSREHLLYRPLPDAMDAATTERLATPLGIPQLSS